MGPFNYFGNACETKEDVEDAIYEAISELELRLNLQTSYEEQRGIRDAYFECFNIEELKTAGFLSYMHPHAFVISNMYDLKLARIANEKAFKNGSAF